jgi:phosphohistidine swiveling domain-containing protein
MNHLFNPERGDQPLPDIGGKGANLFQLQKAHRVPSWVAIPVDGLLSALERDGLGKRIADCLSGLTADNLAETAASIQSLILETDPPDWLECELSKVDFITNPASGYVSVRSSAADEDGTDHSFAGIHESFLYVRGVKSVIRHVQRVWASGYQERALLYRRENGLSLHPVPMAVVIQRMVDATVSGVSFTADPATGNPMSLVISAVYGVGEGLVGAGLPADHIVCSKMTRECQQIVARKETRFVLDKESGEGVVEESVPEVDRENPALSDTQRQDVMRASLAIEQTRRRPQDIEFCFDAKGNLFILQTRDITTATDVGPAAGNRQVWDNANIIESYSGVTTPMTFSFIRHAYTVVYHCFSQVMGIPRRTVQANRPVYENMLGLIRGQVYYNLMNWYRLIQQFPGYGMNKRFMESMMGLRERFDPEDSTVSVPPWRKWLVEFPRLVRLVLRMVFQFMTIEGRVSRFQKRFRGLYEKWEAMDFNALTPHELMAVYREMEAKILWNWQAPIINDFYVMIHYGLLRKLCQDWCGDESQSLQNDLICGNGDIESTEPTRMLMRMALHIRRDPALKERFTKQDHHTLAREIPHDQTCSWLASDMALYLQRYGFRCINELKLESPSLRETPEFVYQILQNYLAVDEAMLDTEAMEAREHAIRQRAEETVDKALAQRSFAWVRRVVFRSVLRNARKGVMNRENMRFARTRIYGVLRELLQAIGRQFVAAGKLDDYHDIFYLTMDEVWDFVKGTAVTTDLKGLVALRRREFDHYESSACPPADDHFDTYGMVYTGNSFCAFQQANPADGDLTGTGCCPGEVTAAVRIVNSPRDDLDLNGCILVAGRTDPGWVPLYPTVKGILIERGSILSHSAIVAREMGIPAIVGIQGLLSTLSDGQTVTMNGQTGTVTIGREA